MSNILSSKSHFVQPNLVCPLPAVPAVPTFWTMMDKERPKVQFDSHTGEDQAFHEMVALGQRLLGKAGRGGGKKGGVIVDIAGVHGDSHRHVETFFQALASLQAKL